MKKIILLDMDGTLTRAREKIKHDMIAQLNSMLADDWKLGIVSGSPIQYMDEQLSLWDSWSTDDSRVFKHPVNGTADLVMEKEYTDFDWNWLIHDIESADARMRCSLGGTYIRHPESILEFRGSSINWCPIGRDANPIQRKKFIGLDLAFNLRIKSMNDIKTRPMFHKKTVIKLGGQTSFDIYPKGWDKSYVFKNYEEFEKIYFIGDRCGPMGNDREGFIKAGNNGIQSLGPEDTISILSKILRESARPNKIPFQLGPST